MHIRPIRTVSFDYICFEYPQPLFKKKQKKQAFPVGCVFFTVLCSIWLLQSFPVWNICSLYLYLLARDRPGPSAHFLAFLFWVRGLWKERLMCFSHTLSPALGCRGQRFTVVYRPAIHNQRYPREYSTSAVATVYVESSPTNSKNTIWFKKCLHI